MNALCKLPSDLVSMQPNRLLTWQIGVGSSLSYCICLICPKLKEPKSYGSYAVIAQSLFSIKKVVQIVYGKALLFNCINRDNHPILQDQGQAGG